MKRLLFAGLLLSASLAAAYGFGVTRREANYRDLLRLGDAAAARGDLTAALEAFSAAVGVKPDSMAAYLKRGEAYRRRGELDAALRDLRRAADLDPTAPRPRELLGDVNYAMGRYARAADRYREYLDLDDSSHRLQYKLGLAQYRAAQPDGCIASMRKAIALDGQFPEAHYVLGLCLRDTQRFKEAIVALQQAIAQAPASVHAREELADVYGRLGRADDRIAQLEALGGLEPAPSREVALGLAYAAVGDTASAVQTLGRAARRYPDSRGTYVALGRVWLEIAQTRDDPVALGKALEALRSAASGGDSEALTLLGRAYLLSSEIEMAEAVLKEAVARLPVEPISFVYLANAAERLGHVADARRALVQYHALEAAAADPRRAARIAIRIADLSMRLDDYERAVHWFQRVVGAGQADHNLLVRLAECEWRAGNAAAAKSTLARVLAGDPQHAAALSLRRRIR